MGTPALWITFNLVVLILLAADLSLFSHKKRESTFWEAGLWSGVWVGLSLGFNLWIWLHYGSKPGLEFFTGYLIEKSLSVDNLFVFALVFHYFSVEPRDQHRVLYWGILGALVMRGGLIAAGVALIHRFEWILAFFGAFLIFAGAKMMFHSGERVDPGKNRALRWMRKVMPLAEGQTGHHFAVRRDGKWMATPLLLVLIVIETADLTFALDSIPAIFSITRDAFIVYSSNVCAILGLRALYFLLARAIPQFQFLDEGLSIVLMFMGTKLVADRW
ncbi:MAG: TerC family protein, partial [Candidatus Acidiferrales bacterium]